MNNYILDSARTLGLAILRPNLPDLPQIPRLLATRIDMTIFCLVPSMAASQARLSSSSSALDFAITVSPLLHNQPRNVNVILDTRRVGALLLKLNMDLYSQDSGVVKSN